MIASRSLQDFWFNVRAGARFIAPTATTDSPRLQSTDFEHILKRATVWLTPKSVAGFNPEDFDFLPTKERQTLAEAVNRFREIARQVPPNQPATDSQIQQTLPQFLRILEILRPDQYADPDALILGKTIERALGDQVPQSVEGPLRFKTGEDASGYPALWIWVVLKDEAAKDEVFYANVRSVRELLENTVHELGMEHWPYVRFRTVAELKPVETKSKK